MVTRILESEEKRRAVTVVLDLIRSGDVEQAGIIGWDGPDKLGTLVRHLGTLLCLLNSDLHMLS